MVTYLARHVLSVSHFPLPCYQLLRTILPRLIVFPPPLMKEGKEIVMEPHGGNELYLQTDSGEVHSTLNVSVLLLHRRGLYEFRDSQNLYFL